MRISEVADRSGVSTSTLRYYERRGMLSPRRASNGYRIFDTDVLEKLRFIEAAKQLNLPLEQIASLVQVWETDACRSVKAQLRPLIEQQLEVIASSAEELHQMGESLAGALVHLSELPDRGERCSPDCAFLSTTPKAPAPVVACALGAGQVDRVATWNRVLAGAPRHSVSGGVRLDLPVESLSEVAELARAEQECCPFFDFDFRLRGPHFTLTITAPPEGQSMLADITETSTRADSQVPAVKAGRCGC